MRHTHAPHPSLLRATLVWAALLALLTWSFAQTEPPLTLSVTPTTVQVGGTVTATLGNVPARGATLEWGDGSVENVMTSGTRTHPYASAGTFTVRLTASQQAPVTAVVVVQAKPMTLTVAPSTTNVNTPVTATFSNLPPTGGTLEWGDGSTTAVTPTMTTSTHAYTSPGVYTVRLTGTNAIPVTAVVVVQAPPISLTVTPNLTRPGGTVTAVIANLVPNTSVSVDWGDGSAPTTTTAAGTGFATVTVKHDYMTRSPDGAPFLVRASTRDQTSPPAPVTVRVPPAQLTVVKVGQRGTATTLLPTGLVSDDAAYVYSVAFDDGTTTPASNGVPILREFATSGPKTATLKLNAAKYGVTNLTVATATFNVPDAVTTVEATSAIVVGTTAVGAPTEASVKQGASATSRVTLTTTTTGDVKLRWRLAPIAPKDGSAPPSNVLDERVVKLTPGTNTVTLTLPTHTVGRFLLTIELLPPSPEVTTPTPRVLPVQAFDVTSTDAPKTLVIGDGDRRYEFKLDGATLGEQPNTDGTYDLTGGTVTITSLLVATNEVMDGARQLNLGPSATGNPTAVLGTPYQPLRVNVDGDRAVLAAGSFRVNVGKPAGSTTKQRSLFIAALRPMGLRVGDVVFDVTGAELRGATLVSPDYTPVTFTDYFNTVLYAKDEFPTSKGVEGKLLELVDLWTSGDPMLVGGVGAPVDFMPGKGFTPGVNVRRGPQFASQVGRAPQYTSAKYDPTGKVRSGFAQVASKGIVNSKGTKLNPAIFTGEIDIAELPVNLAALEKDLDKMPGVVSFPSLVLYADGDVTTPTPGGPRGGSAADYHAKPVVPETTGTVSGPIGSVTTGGASGSGWFGTLKLGDSGVSLLAGSANVITLDLSATRAAKPLGGGDQEPLVRETYAGGVGIVKQPDTGPKWQGLLWQSRNLSYSFLQGTDTANSVGGNGSNASDYFETYVSAVPVSFGLGGWNLDINQKLAKKGTFSNGWLWSNDSVSVVIVRSNLLRSTRTGALESNLPLLGGKGRVRGTLVWKDGALSTETKFEEPINWVFGYGASGSVKVTNVKFVPTKNMFQLQAEFDLTPSVTPLKVNCTQLNVTPLTTTGGGVSAPPGSCAFPKNVSIANTKLTLTQATPTGDSLVFVTQVRLGDKPAAGGSTEPGGLTLPGSLTLSSSGASTSDYTFTNYTKGGAFDMGGGVNFTVKEAMDDLRAHAAMSLGAGSALPTFEIRRTGELNPGLPGTNAKASMTAIFGNDPTGSYWSVRFTAAKLPSPITVGPLLVHGFTGGIAYRMSWDDLTGSGGAYNALMQDPKRSTTAFTLAAGVLASLTDDSVLHFAGGLTADSNFVVQIGADLYLLTSGMNSASGYNNGKGAPNARMWVKIDPKADLAILGEFCVGPAAQLKGDKLACGDVKQLTILGGNLSLTGRALIGLSFKTPANSYVYVGRYRPPGVTCAGGANPNTDVNCAKLYAPARIQAKIFKSFDANVYAMIGALDPSVSSSFVQSGSKGLAVGGEMHYEYKTGGSGSVLVCDYTWNVYFGLGGGGDLLLITNPNTLDGNVGFWAAASVGGSFCGYGASLGADIKISGTLHLSENTGNYLDGHFTGQVRMPGPIPNIGLDFHKRVDF